MAEQGQVQPKVVIAGFGLPGRAIAETLDRAGVPYTVIERNPAVCDRCDTPKHHFFHGDARDVALLRAAGVATAELFALMIPGDTDVLAAIDAARVLNPGIAVVARAMYTSVGMAANQRRNVTSIIAEQLVAIEAAKVVKSKILRGVTGAR